MQWLIDKIKRIDPLEKKFILLISLILMVISGLPSLVGHLFSPKGLEYFDLRSFAISDLFVYFSYINQIKSGNWLFYDLFTSESQNIGMFNIWWLAVGLVAKIFNLSANIAFVITRIFLIPVLVAVFYLFCSYFLDNRWQRIAALWIGFFSGGFGFLVILFISPYATFTEVGIKYNWPIDLWITEATLFNATFFSPLVVMSFIFTMLVLLLMLVSFSNKKLTLSFVAGILALVYFNFHPYYWPIMIGVPALFALTESLIAKKIQWKMFFGVAILFFISFPSVAYHIWLIENNSVISFRALQNISPMSSPLNLLIGYGFLWFGFLLGTYFLLKNKLFNSKMRYLVIWLLVLLFFSYSPFPFQSRYTQGMQIPLVIMTVFGLWYVWKWLKKKVQKNYYEFFIENKFFLAIVFVVVFSLSALFNFSRDIYYLTNPVASQLIVDNYYVNQDFQQVISFLDKFPKMTAIVLSQPSHGRIVAAFSSQKSFIGHTHETIFFKSKVLSLNWFYSTKTSNQARERFLYNNKINYVLVDLKKNPIDFSGVVFLQSVISNDNFVLYQVLAPKG